eukprot:Selendium_serpulae@DN5559_c0_g1_i1.p1
MNSHRSTTSAMQPLNSHRSTASVAPLNTAESINRKNSRCQRKPGRKPSDVSPSCVQQRPSTASFASCGRPSRQTSTFLRDRQLAAGHVSPKEAIHILQKELKLIQFYASEERLLKAMIKEAQIDEEIDHYLVYFGEDEAVKMSLQNIRKEMKDYLQDNHVYHRTNIAVDMMKRLGLESLVYPEKIMVRQTTTDFPRHNIKPRRASLDTKLHKRLAANLKVSTVVKRSPTSKSDWKEEKYGNLEVHYKVEKHDDSITVKVRGKLKCQLYHVLAILSEPEATPLWVPFLKGGRNVASLSKASSMVYQYYEYPFPIGKRDSFVYAFGIDSIEENGNMMLFTTSTEVDATSYLGIPISKPAKKVKRNDPAESLWTFHPCENGNAAVIDITTKFATGVKLPQSLINWCIKRVARGVYIKLATLATNLHNTPIQKKVDDNPEFYGWVNSRAAAFYEGGHHHRFTDLEQPNMGTFVCEE